MQNCVSTLQSCTWNNQRKQFSRQAKKQLERENVKGLTNKGSQTGANKHVKHMKGQTSMLSNKWVCPRRKNIGLDQVSIVPWDWSMDDICAIK